MEIFSWIPKKELNLLPIICFDALSFSIACVVWLCFYYIQQPLPRSVCHCYSRSHRPVSVGFYNEHTYNDFSMLFQIVCIPDLCRHFFRLEEANSNFIWNLGIECNMHVPHLNRWRVRVCVLCSKCGMLYGNWMEIHKVRNISAVLITYNF